MVGNRVEKSNTWHYGYHRGRMDAQLGMAELNPRSHSLREIRDGVFMTVVNWSPHPDFVSGYKSGAYFVNTQGSVLT